MTDLGVAVLSTIPSLTSLSLAQNLAITDAALPLLARLTNLCSLNLTHSKISGNGLTALYGLTVSCSTASWESECMQDVTAVSSLPAGLLAVCIHAGCASTDQSDFSRLLACPGSACVCRSSGVTHAMYADKTLHTAFVPAFLHQDIAYGICASISVAECAYMVWHAGTDLILSI